jgi:hypothetical protein
VLTICLSLLVYRQPINAAYVAGASLVFGAILLQQLEATKRKRGSLSY